MTPKPAVAVVARIAPARVPAVAPVPAPAAHPATAVEALRQRLASGSAREHVVLDFLEDDLREARGALAAVAAFFANVEGALGADEPSRERLLSLAAGTGPAERIEYLSQVLASARRRLAQVAARM